MAAEDRALRLALCQLNSTVGDIPGNEARIAEALQRARSLGAQLVLFPELAITGYPPEDLLLRDHFLTEATQAIQRLAAHAEDVVVVVGFPERAEGVFNAAAVLAGGRVHAVHRKVLLPNYGVFDEHRYFQEGSGASVIDIGPHRVGLTVCEDIWKAGPPASDAALAGATLLVNISASPYHVGKGTQREEMIAQRARENLAAVAFCALVGGQDELVFDGQSFVVDHTGAVIARAAQFEEEILICDVDLAAAAAGRVLSSEPRTARRRAAVLEPVELPPASGPPPRRHLANPLPSREAEVYGALQCGLRDYVHKNGFDRVVLGLSGGIDSALVACIAADSLGPESVSVAVMPSPFSSLATQGDARKLAATLEVECLDLPIKDAMEAYDALLTPVFGNRPADITEENLQARIRGNLLMALSNKFGWLVLTTGNKSEMSVGYSTLYGDSAGGFAVIKDVEKTLVYGLAVYRNDSTATLPQHPIPPSVLERAPSAELRHDQRDDDSLPPYPVLDAILRGYVEEDRSRDELVQRGLSRVDVDRVLRLVDSAEYKRRQAPPGIKITERAFGRDRRMPITNRYGR